MNFEFATANRIIFGSGRLSELPDLARKHGSSALVVIGKNADRSESIRRMLTARGISVSPFTVPSEPTLELVAEGAAEARFRTADSIIGFGGGSVIDAAKAIAALATNRRPTLDYLEIIGKNQPLQIKPLPTIAIPTTAGAGSEVTRNAVLTSVEHRRKVSLRHPWILPELALVDPELTHSMPASVTAATGLDALSQLVEPFVSNRANPMTDALCREGLGLAARSLRTAFHHGLDPQARNDMCMAALFGGLALANGGLGAVHGFAAPVGAVFSAPHGAVCAALLPAVMRINIRSSQGRRELEEITLRYEEIARRLTGSPTATAMDGADWVDELRKELHIPGLGHYGLSAKDVPEIVEKAKSSSSMRANPVAISDAELAEILHLSN